MSGLLLGSDAITVEKETSLLLKLSLYGGGGGGGDRQQVFVGKCFSGGQ